MSFVRNNLPDPVTYYESRGLKLEGRGKWRTTRCEFHGGSDSLRINVGSGAFVCMAGCGARGGDVLAYAMAADGVDFMTAAKAMGAWVEDGQPAPQRPSPISPRDALTLLAHEAMLVGVAAANVGHGVALTQEDLARVLTAAGRIQFIREVAL